jgi:DUF4097 and DUF4098 domain-containing protein YvlB
MFMFRREMFYSLVVLVLLVGSIAIGQQVLAADDLAQDFSFSANERPSLHIKNITGTVRVETWDKMEIKVSVTRRSDDVRVNVREEKAANRVSLEVEDMRPLAFFNLGDRKRVDFVAYVPPLTDFDGNLVSGDMSIEGTGGSLGDLSVRTVSADVLVDSAKNTRVETTSGKIDIREIDGSVRAKSVSGDVVVDVAEDTEVDTTSGRIELRKIEGKVAVDTISGRIDVTDADAPDMRIKSTSGDILAETSIKEGGSYSFGTISGRIALKLPKDTQARIDASFVSSGVSVGFQVRLESTGSREFRGVIGDGRAQIRINTVSGKIDVLQK